MLHMELATLRKEDEISVKPPTIPTMRQIFKQAPPCQSSRDALAKRDRLPKRSPHHSHSQHHLVERKSRLYSGTSAAFNEKLRSRMSTRDVRATNGTKTR
jgi:hypothetical protein